MTSNRIREQQQLRAQQTRRARFDTEQTLYHAPCEANSPDTRLSGLFCVALFPFLILLFYDHPAKAGEDCFLLRYCTSVMMGSTMGLRLICL